MLYVWQTFSVHLSGGVTAMQRFAAAAEVRQLGEPAPDLARRHWPSFLPELHQTKKP